MSRRERQRDKTKKEMKETRQSESVLELNKESVRITRGKTERVRKKCVNPI